MISPLYIELIADYDSVREKKKVDNSVIKKRFILKKQKL